jgi:hypothetical protein
MTTDLRNLMARVQTWPEAAKDELVAIANQIESELHAGDYLATRQELQTIDAALTSIDAGGGKPLRTWNRLRPITPPTPVRR